MPAETNEIAELAALEARAWQSLLAATGASARAGNDPWLERCGEGFAVSPQVPPSVRPLLELYAPLCSARRGRTLALAHLGQSLDGHIATASGDSYYVTGPDNVRHLHRLRALCSAVIVGAGTVARDDPQLTVRHVAGPNPVRVVLDPNARLEARRRVFTDGAAPTIVVHAAGRKARAPGAAEILEVPVVGGDLKLDVLLERLRDRGLTSVFVEGGGATVSRFLEAGLLDRLQIAIAPLVTGRGFPGLSVSARDHIGECLRPVHRVFTMGGDVLFDCDLRAAAPASNEATGSLTRAL